MLDTVIIGLGPSGLTALLYSGMYGLNVVGIGDQIGGKLAFAPSIIDYPGIVNIHGKDFVENLLSQLKEKQTNPLTDEVLTVAKSKTNTNVFQITTKDGQIYESKTLLMATGNGAKRKVNQAQQMLAPFNVTFNQGLVQVNSTYETNVNNIFACGDCISYPASLEQLATAVTTGIGAIAAIFERLRGKKPPILWGKSQLPRRL